MNQDNENTQQHLIIPESVSSAGKIDNFHFKSTSYRLTGFHPAGEMLKTRNLLNLNKKVTIFEDELTDSGHW